MRKILCDEAAGHVKIHEYHKAVKDYDAVRLFSFCFRFGVFYGVPFYSRPIRPLVHNLSFSLPPPYIEEFVKLKKNSDIGKKKQEFEQEVGQVPGTFIKFAALTIV